MRKAPSWNVSLNWNSELEPQQHASPTKASKATIRRSRPADPQYRPPRHVVSRRKPQHTPLWIAVVVSLLAHMLLLGWIFGGQGLGVPGLGWLKPERRAEAREPRVVLLPPRTGNVAPLAMEPRPPDIHDTVRTTRPVALPKPLLDEVKVAASPTLPATAPTIVERVQEPSLAPASPPLPSGDAGSESSTPQAAIKPATISAPGPGPTSVPEAAPPVVSSPTPPPAAETSASAPEVEPNTPAQEAASITEQASKAVRARELEQHELERHAREATEQRVAAERAEAVRLQAEREKQARLEDERLAALKAAALREEAARQEATRQAAQQLEAAQREAAQREGERQETMRRQAAQDEARREAARRAMGRQLDEEAAQREAAARASAANPGSSISKRRGRLLGRTDTNSELVLYAEAWARRIQLNTRPERTQRIAQRPHTAPLVNVAIRSDGSLESITFVVSSGVADIDQAVRDIVQELLPYSPFSAALARDFDVIEIRRSWQFDTAVRLH